MKIHIKDVTHDFLVKEDFNIEDLKHYLRIIRKELKDSEHVFNNLNKDAFVKKFLEENKQFTMVDAQQNKQAFSDAIKYLTTAESIFKDRIKELENKSPGQKIVKAMLDKSDTLKALKKMGNVDFLYNGEEIKI